MNKETMMNALISVKGYAHRGLHDIERGVVENSPSAFQAALKHKIGIELDVQMSSDKVPLVFHDEILSRLCDRDGRLAFMRASELTQIPYRQGHDRIMSLEDLLEMVQGQVPLLIEVKSHWHGKPQMEKELVSLLSSYDGAYGLMSFDLQVLDYLKKAGSSAPLGLVSARTPPKDWIGLSEEERQIGRVHFERAAELQVDFLAHHVQDLSNPTMLAFKKTYDLPLFSWTVSRPSLIKEALTANAIPIFEGTAASELIAEPLFFD